VYIPATPAEGFVMGRGLASFGFGNRASKNLGRGAADAPHRVVLTRPFCIDATEVTAGAMVRCVEARKCRRPVRPDRWMTYPNKPDQPVNMVDWAAGKAFCEHLGKSLPTEAQWEWAATGGDGRKWPWGDEPPTCQRADFTSENLVSPGGDSGCHGGGPSVVGAHPEGDRIWPGGRVHDLAGNVWEWVLDTYEPFSGQREVDPLHVTAGVGNRVIRGGGWNRSGRGIMAAFRGGAVITYEVPGLGFRCVRNPGS
jgi:formylglycine-generating enzyme required for sulfatase activity